MFMSYDVVHSVKYWMNERELVETALVLLKDDEVN